MSDKFINDQTIKAGSTSVSTTVELKAGTTGLPVTGQHAGAFTLNFLRQGGTLQTVAVSTPANDLATIDAAYSSGGIKEFGGNACGMYRFDWPDTAFASGADWVELVVKCPGSATATQMWHQRIALTTLQPIADATLATQVEVQGAYTLKQAMSIVLSVLAGRTNNSGSNILTPDGAATRVSATINQSNERTTMTLTPSA